MFHLAGMLADFNLAWRLLTIIPLPLTAEDKQRPAGWAAAYYPLVGLIIGFILVVVALPLQYLLPGQAAAAILLAVWIALTGMLHLDGFMDSCDGLLPPREPTRRLEIMKDSRVGAFGVVGAVLLLLLKFNGLAALGASYQMAALITIPALARWAMTWAMARYPLARSQGTSVFFTAGLGWQQLVVASVMAGGPVVFFWGIHGLILWGVAWITTTLVARFAVARINGLTGDVYGAICEVTEAMLLITVPFVTNF
jgi:adenosylcobinamide-GDP ribazoletransferase